MVILGGFLAFALAFNISANNAGVHMAPAYGVGARRKWTALILFAIFTALGALLLGDEVSRTVGQDLFKDDFKSDTWLFLVLAPTITLVLLVVANLMKVPTPTTPVAIFSLVGVGMAYNMVNTPKLFEVLAWWVASPIATLVLTWGFGKILLAKFPAHAHHDTQSPRAKKWIGLLLTIEGCYSAFAIGANNVGNAVGPLFGAGKLEMWVALALGAAGFVAGSLVWGGRVLETVGKGITELCHIRALVVGVVTATGLLVASLYGAPVSGALVVTSGMIGFSLASTGVRGTAGNRNIRRIVVVWTASPAAAVLVAYLLVIMAG